ncbi:MAG: ABC transporter substrate binding protein [Desulfatitalea sp.]
MQAAVVAVVVLLVGGSAPEARNRSLTPATNHGRPWRIGYYEGGPYINYPANLKAIADGLVALGWLKPTRFNDSGDPKDARAVWQALGVEGGYLEFVPEAFWSADWDLALRERNRTAALRALQNRQVDFMIAMGTWAGQDLVNDQHAVPTMLVSTSDPVGSKIIVSAADSGFDHVHARCDPTRYERQLRLFHGLFDFQRLGIVYEDTVAGRSYAALADVHKVAIEQEFTVISCKAPFSGVPQAESTARLIECHQRLAPQIDALFMTIHRGVDLERMEAILAPLLAHKIPTWSQRGPEEVRQGVLLSISRGGFKAVGSYHAQTMVRILNGARPRDLPQLFEDPQTIAINLKTAATIGFAPPKGLMKVADEIYK